MPNITYTEIDARINALAQQRNSAMDQVVVLAGQIAVKDGEIAELKAKIKDLVVTPDELGNADGVVIKES